MISDAGRLVADEILSRLPSRRFLRDLIVLERTGSTNDYVASLGRQGIAEGVAVFAECQTAGRGRLGRPWQSDPGAGLWFSLLARPAWPLALWTRLTLWAAWSAALGIEAATGVEIALKWPNDLYAGGRKLTGILVESIQGFAVVGIGINANQERFPGPLASTATSLRLETGAPVDRNALAARVLESLDRTYPALPGNFPEILRWARERDWLLGKFVSIENAAREGVASGLDDDGALLLRAANGELQRVASGEVTRIVAARH